jgi:hypothetical protein
MDKSFTPSMRRSFRANDGTAYQLTCWDNHDIEILATYEEDGREVEKFLNLSIEDFQQLLALGQDVLGTLALADDES